jgi:cephalosporin-C deacetylase-like acetyl esterase
MCVAVQDYGKTFVKLDNGMLRENSVKDIGALLDWIALQPELDASRVLVMGGSYGGYMSLAVSVHYADKIRCAIDVVGISNFNTFLKNTESYRRDLRRVEYGDEQDPKMFAFLEKISPLNNAAKIKKPLFIVQEEMIRVCPEQKPNKCSILSKSKAMLSGIWKQKMKGMVSAKKPIPIFSFMLPLSL